MATVETLALHLGVTFESRVAFMTEAATRVCKGPRRLNIDCSPRVAVDDATIGTLTLVARNDATRGVAIVLSAPTPGLLDALDNADILDRFQLA
jgi:hypothetical protein